MIDSSDIILFILYFKIACINSSDIEGDEFYILPIKDVDYVQAALHYKRLSEKQKAVSFVRSIKKYCRFPKERTTYEYKIAWLGIGGHVVRHKYYFYCKENEYCRDHLRYEKKSTCECYAGYARVDIDRNEGEDSNCQDINECDFMCNSFPKVCYNYPGNWACNCLEGYEKTPMGCEDIDECRIGNVCPQNSLCVNTPGRFRCICEQDYTLQEDHCQAKDKCSLVFCHPFISLCQVDDNGKAVCVCAGGFGLFSSRCADLDECNDKGRCGYGQVCVNMVGTFRCECATGFRQTSEAYDVTKMAFEHHTTPENGEWPKIRSVNEAMNVLDGIEVRIYKLRRGHSVFGGKSKDAMTELLEKVQSLQETLIVVVYKPNGLYEGDLALVAEIRSLFYELTESRAALGVPKSVERQELSCEDIDECTTVNCTQVYNKNFVCYNTKGSYKCYCHAGYDIATDCERKIGESTKQVDGELNATGGFEWVHDDRDLFQNDGNFILLYTWIAVFFSMGCMVVHLLCVRRKKDQFYI